MTKKSIVDYTLTYAFFHPSDLIDEDTLVNKIMTDHAFENDFKNKRFDIHQAFKSLCNKYQIMPFSQFTKIIMYSYGQKELDSLKVQYISSQDYQPKRYYRQDLQNALYDMLNDHRIVDMQKVRFNKDFVLGMPPFLTYRELGQRIYQTTFKSEELLEIVNDMVNTTPHELVDSDIVFDQLQLSKNLKPIFNQFLLRLGLIESRTLINTLGIEDIDKYRQLRQASPKDFKKLEQCHALVTISLDILKQQHDNDKSINYWVIDYSSLQHLPTLIDFVQFQTILQNDSK